MSDSTPPYEIRWREHLAVNHATAWAWLSDTDSFNRHAGLGLRFREEATENGGVLRIGFVRKYGMNLSWVEEPWRFSAPDRFSFARQIREGVVQTASVECTVTEADLHSSWVEYVLRVYPRFRWAYPLVALETAWLTRAQIDRAFVWLHRSAAAGHPLEEAPILPARVLQSLNAKLQGISSTSVGEGLSEWVRLAPDREVERLFPKRLAKRWRVTEEAAVLGCLEAVREGVLTLSWELLCPTCFGPKVRPAALSARPLDVHCLRCNLTFDGTFPDAVQVVFGVAPDLRTASSEVDCLLSPARTPHVLVSEAMDPGQELEFGLALEAGSYQLATDANFGAVRVEVSPSAQASRVAIRWTETGPEPVSVRVRPGVVQWRVGSELPRSAMLTLRQRWMPAGALLASELLANAEACALLPADALSPGTVLEVVQQAVLAVEAVGDLDLRNELARLDPASVRRQGTTWLATWPNVGGAVHAIHELSNHRAAFALGAGAVVWLSEGGDALPGGEVVHSVLAAVRGAPLRTLVISGDDEELWAAVRRQWDTAQPGPWIPLGPSRGGRGAPVIGHRYSVGRELGRGGMGVVYEATDVDTGRTVAIKTLHPERDSEASVQGFFLEGRWMTRIRHPHVATVFDYGRSADGQLYLVMERLKGRNCQLPRGEYRSEAEVRQIGIQALLGLEAIHRLGVVHQDIKPANVFKGEDGIVKLLDFGLAEDGRKLVVRNEEDPLRGTPAFIAPEQVDGESPITTQTDLYGLGITLYRLASGRLPFEAPDPLVQLAMRISQEPTPIRQRSPQPLSDGFVQVIETALQRDPAKRWADAAAMRRALEAT